VKILLDTHALIWVMNGNPRLGPGARKVIADRTNEVFVSAASIWEASTKFRLGKFPEAKLLLDNPEKVLNSMGIDPLAISLEHARLAGSIGVEHRDPFDRMLAAQSRLEGMTLASADEVFDTLGVSRLWR
jgi:PIN domain nuclease of toxin-antitoxin system